jgi:hypothetical protein
MVMQEQGNYAPIAAYENINGELAGFLYINVDDTYTLSSKQVIERMEADFEKKLSNQEIKSYTIFYHSQFANDNYHDIALNDSELKAISIIYHFENGQKGKIGLPYFFENDEIRYTEFKDFDPKENDAIFNIQLTENKGQGRN